jgi:uncharacterized membrane protein YkoI
MTRKTIAAAGLALVLGAGAIGAAAALGGGDGDAGEQVTGPAADRAARAALHRFRGARVTSVERDGDGAAPWEAEVTRPDGSTVDVALDRDYRIVALDEEGDRDDAGRDDDERGDDERADDDERGDDERGDDERGDDDEPGADERADDGDTQTTGAAAQRAGAAALARFPGGRVTSIERDADGDATWEVEVTRSDGATVDVDLDAALRIIAVDDPE